MLLIRNSPLQILFRFTHTYSGFILYVITFNLSRIYGCTGNKEKIVVYMLFFKMALQFFLTSFFFFF